MCNPKLIIFSETGYHKKHNAFLKNQIKQGCELFCITGEDAGQWQSAIEQLISTINTDNSITCIVKDNTSWQELNDFAQQYKTLEQPDSEADIIYV